MIKVTDLTFSYEDCPEKQILKGITFSLTPGTITAVIGLSGCGKSTLCQILCGIIPKLVSGHLTGEVQVNGLDVAAHPLPVLSQKIGYMMQDPDRQMIASTVEDELAFGPENLALPPEEIRARVSQTMELLGISHLALKNPSALSGGQKQLAAAGAILTMEPDVFIMDEPLSHIDEKGKLQMINLIKDLRQQGKTVLVVEHDYPLLDFADQWMVLDRGKIKAFGSPEELLKKGFIL